MKMQSDSSSSDEHEENVDISYIKYLIDYIPPEIQKIAEEELGETEEVKVRCLKELKDLIKDVPEFNPCTDDVFLLRFLRCRKFDVQKAFSNLINFYMLKARYSGILTNLTPSDVKHVLDLYHGYGLEHRDPNHIGIALFRLGLYDVDTDDIDYDEVFAAVLLLGEAVMNYEAIQITGYSVIVDMTGLSFRKVRQMATPSLIRRFVSNLTDTTPIRLNSIHLINNPFYFTFTLNIGKRFLSEKIRERIHLHGNDLESLHKFIPPAILPEELGGKQGPLEKHAKIFIQKMYDEEDYYIKMNSFGFTGEKLKELKKDNDLNVSN